MKLALALLFVSCVIYGQKPDSTIAFEVASLKASPPADQNVRPVAGCTGGPGTPDPGQYTCRRALLAALVGTAFDLRGYQWSGLGGREAFSFPPGAPSPAYWDLAAKVPSGATPEQFRTMYQNLLIERFKLAYHFEKKEMDGYELVAAKGGPKLTESQPIPAAAAAAEQTAARAPGPPAVAPDGCPLAPLRTGMSQLSRNGVRCVVWVGASIAQLAALLSSQLSAPVTDATALKEVYDFKLRYSPAAREMDDAPGLIQALQNDLGLRLEKKKAPVDVFVVDHVEKEPTEN